MKTYTLGTHLVSNKRSFPHSLIYLGDCSLTNQHPTTPPSPTSHSPLTPSLLFPPLSPPLSSYPLSPCLRSHECVRTGFARPYEDEDEDLLCTIFSASNYGNGTTMLYDPCTFYLPHCITSNYYPITSQLTHLQSLTHIHTSIIISPPHYLRRQRRCLPSVLL